MITEKGQMIFELVKSINTGNCVYPDTVVDTALQQYEQMKELGLIIEEDDD